MNVGYRFGPFVLDPKRRTVTRDGAPLGVMPKAFDILMYLVQHPSRVVTKQELMKAVWPDTFVEDGNLIQNISLLRKALGETDEAPLIVTVARQGYQFTADVVELDSLPPAVAAVPAPRQRRARLPAPPWLTALAAAVVALAVLAAASLAWQRSQAGSSSGSPVRLAVLPFANLTGDSNQQYLADGLTEELITQLARLRPEQLGVIARTSVMRYKHGDKPLDEIGRELSVGYALESSLRRSANRLRVTVQLTRVHDQSHVWASDFDYPQQDVFHIEDSVAAAVAREVQLRLTPAQRARMTDAPSTDVLVVDAVMRGHEHLVAQLGKGGWEAAKRDFDRAIALDSSFALAWAWLSATVRYGVNRGYMPAESGYREARQAASRALALDPTLPEAWEQLGMLQWLVDWDWAAANTSFQRALELDPGNVEVNVRFAGLKDELGDFDGGIALERRAMQLDPLDVDGPIRVSWMYYGAGRLEDAQKALETVPPELRNTQPQYLVLLDLAEGRTADAERMVAQVPDSVTQLYDRVLVWGRQGRRRAADSVLNVVVGQYHTVAAFQLGELYASRGESDSAFAWLDRAYQQRDQGLAAMKTSPFLASLRHDPRYNALLTKMRLPP